MPSLAQHLLADDHDSLSFRSDCARCRARLRGRLPEPSVLSHRQQAALATGLVTAGSLLPAGAAGAHDAPAHPGRDAPVVLEAPGDHGKPTNDQVASPNPPRPGESPGQDTKPSPPPVAVVEPAHPERPQRPPRPSPPRRTPAAAPPSTRAPSVGDAGPQPPPRDRRERSEPRRADPRSRLGPHDQTTPHAPTRDRAGRSAQRAAARKRAPVDAPSAPAPRDQPAPPAAAPAGADGSTHVVQAGECLWSIAAQRLGTSAGDAQVAAYVQRLWEANAGHIATGTPNLIYPGQQLRLP